MLSKLFAFLSGITTPSRGRLWPPSPPSGARVSLWRHNPLQQSPVLGRLEHFALLTVLSLTMLGIPQVQAATYNWSSLGSDDSGGSGFKTVGTAGLVVSNIFADATNNEIYPDNSTSGASETVVIKAGSSVCQFDVGEMRLYAFAPTTFDQFDINFKDSSGTTITSLSQTSYILSADTPQTLADIFGSFSGATGISEIEIVLDTAEGGSFPANITFTNIDLDNITSAPCAPSVSTITRADANPTNATSVDFTVTFSDSVTGVDTSDFSLTKTDTADGSVSNVSGSGSSYTVTVNSITGDGTLRLDVTDDDTITNGTTPLGGTGTGNGNFTSGEEYTIAEPTYVELLEGSFKASGSYLPDFDLYYTEINWDSGMELNNAFFVILKRGEEEGEYEETKVWWCDGGNDEIDCETGWEHAFNIPAQGDGWSYQVFDTEVRKGKTYYYKLMDVELDGDSTEHDESIIEATIPE